MDKWLKKISVNKEETEDNIKKNKYNKTSGWIGTVAW